MNQTYYQKHMLVRAALDEIKMVLKVDKIDPEQIFHIGKPVISPSDLQILNGDNDKGKLTIQYPHGGIALNEISDSDIDLNLFKNLETIFYGLSVLNSHGIYHLDVKLPNMVRNQDTGQIRLIDFGIAQDNNRELNDLFANTYPIWPFEICMLSGIDIDFFSDTVYKEYVNDAYFKIIMQHIPHVDISEIKDNVRQLSKLSFATRCIAIYNKIDSYSMGIVIMTILQRACSLPHDFERDLRHLGYKLLCFDTLTRLDMHSAHLEYSKIISMYIS